jgi:hypothetical protein
MAEERTHFNVGGPRGWTAACGIESSSFVGKPEDWDDVDCRRCMKKRPTVEGLIEQLPRIRFFLNEAAFGSTFTEKGRAEAGVLRNYIDGLANG